MSDAAENPVEGNEPPLYGVLAEYDTPHDLVKASRVVRDAGYTKWDTYSPFAIHGIEKAMGIRMTVLPWLVLVCGITGFAFAVWLQWWTNAVDYPFKVSGKPFWSVPANVPIMFELMVLFSAFGSLGFMLILNNLPLPSHPLDFKERFSRSTDDKFFLLIQSNDPKFDKAEARELLETTSPVDLDDVNEDQSTSDQMPKGVIYGMIILTLAALVPFAAFAKARETQTRQRRIHAIWDMDFQPKYKAQRPNSLFADGRAMRQPPDGTVAVGDLQEDDHFYRGKQDGHWALTFPKQIAISEETILRGQERFGIYCSPCHGYSGNGEGMVNKRASELQQRGVAGNWVPPANLQQTTLMEKPVGELFNTITHGIRNMPAYGHQIDPEDRWAIIMYLRALQKMKVASVQDLTPAEREALKE